MSNDPPLEKPISKYCSKYPKPEAEYQEIIQNPDIFLQKLLTFHVFYGTKFRVPTLGGNRLDLHRLFLEVTSRGGIEKVYYFRKEEPNISSPATRSANGSTLPHSLDDGAAFDQLAASPNLEEGTFVNGTIDGKFDFGYLVTVNIGGENLKGVLYHTPEVPNASVSLSTLTCGEPGHHRTRRKHQMAFRDPAHPKRNRSGYTFFFAEQYHRLRPMYHGQERAISRKIGQLWGRLTEAEKQVYQEKGLRDKERYKAEMSEYKTSQHVPA